jgi:hypothetical protein
MQARSTYRVPHTAQPCPDPISLLARRAVYYSPLALRALLAPHKFALPLMAPKPPPKKMGYYTAWVNRGYLSPEVQLRELKER